MNSPRTHPSDKYGTIDMVHSEILQELMPEIDSLLLNGTSENLDISDVKGILNDLREQIGHRLAQGEIDTMRDGLIVIKEMILFFQKLLCSIEERKNSNNTQETSPVLQ